MLRIFDKYSPNANPANTSYPHGSGKDESVSGANDGTPLEMDWYNDMLGYSEALLAEAGITASGAADTALTSDRMTAFRIAAMRVETAVAYNGGNVSRVGVIALVTGEDVTDYDYIVDGDSLTRWSVGTVTGVFAGDFNSVTGVDSGLSGALYLLQSNEKGTQITRGTATFTNSTNNINLTNIGLNREVGDVIDLSGSLSASASTTPYFTIDEITDLNNVIVNKAHANGTSGKSLVDETLTITISLVSKWNVASNGLGRAYVDVKASRSIGAVYTNNTGRDYEILASCDKTSPASPTLNIDGLSILAGPTSGISDRELFSFTIEAGSSYSITNVASINSWLELR